MSLFSVVFGLPDGALDQATAYSLHLAGMPGIWGLLVLLAGLTAAAWLVARTYRIDGHLTTGRRRLLIALRLCAIALAVFAALGPTLVVRRNQDRTGAVAVLIDDSGSMAWRDAGASGPTRLDQVRTALAPVLPKLAAVREVPLYAFSGATFSEASPGVVAIHDLTLTGEGRTSDPAGAVRAVIDQREGSRTAALVVVSDGIATTGEAAARMTAAARLAADRGLTVWALAVGSTTPPRNRAVVRIQAPRSARAGNPIAASVLLAGSGLDAGGERQVRVQLERRNLQEPGAAWEPIDSDGAGELEGSALLAVDLTIPPQPVGRWRWRATIPDLPGEQVVEDNHAEVEVEVSDAKHRVLLVGGTSTWEFQFLRSYLLRQQAHYALSAWQQDADPRFNQESSAGNPLSALPTTAAGLEDFDAVILIDPQEVPDSVDARFVQALDTFVGRRHGGLAFVAGRRFSEGLLAAGSPLARLTDLLPVVPGRCGTGPGAPGEPAPTPIRLAATDEGLALPVLRIRDQAQPGELRSAWSQLPGAYRIHPVARLKPAATALVVADDATRRSEDGGPLPVIAWHHYGRGRVLWLGIDSTWRWRPVDQAKISERFWGGVVDALAAAGDERRRLVVNTAADQVEAGDDLRVAVDAFNRDDAPLDLSELPLVVQMLGDDGVAGEVISTIRLPRLRPGVFEGTLHPVRTGRFLLTIPPDGAGAWTAEDVAARTIEVRTPQAERRRLARDDAALAQLTGDPSRVLPIERAGELPFLIGDKRQVVIEERRHGLGSAPLLLGLIAGLLVTELILRKRQDLM